MPYLIDSLQKSFLQLRAQMETNAVLPVNIQSVYLNNFTQELGYQNCKTGISRFSSWSIDWFCK